MASEKNVAVNFLVGEPKVRKPQAVPSERRGAAIVGEMKNLLGFSLLLHLEPPQKSKVFILCSFSYRTICSNLLVLIKMHIIKSMSLTQLKWAI